MLKDDFFLILNYTGIDDSNADFTISLNQDHIIYQAHFPNNPITPGVCIIQIAQELFSFFKQTDFGIKKLKSVKFTHPIVPTVHNVVNFKMGWQENDATFQVKVIVYTGDIIFSKINMQLEEKDS